MSGSPKMPAQPPTSQGAESYLHTLPAELLLQIKESIPLSDMRTHVCFHRSYELIAKLYDSVAEAESFWKAVCWYSGIGLVMEEERAGRPKVCWRNIALETIEQDGFCAHPDCGGALLARNAEHMARIVTTPYEWPAVTPHQDWSSHDLLPCLAWEHFDAHHLRPDAYSGHLRPVPSAEGLDLDRRLLHRHPAAYRSFASFPPVQSMSILELYSIDWPTLKRSGGITVWDVYNMLDAQIDNPLEVYSLMLFASDWERYLPSNWTLTEALGRLTSLRGFFSVIRLDGIARISSPRYDPLYELKVALRE